MKVFNSHRYVSLDQISPHFRQAILAVEDSGFYQHHGVDVPAVLRAGLNNLRQGKVVQGASTITQQLSKNMFLSFDKSFSRKVTEMLLAFQIETSFSKAQILEAYCNQIYFGRGMYGIANASWKYFGKTSAKLTLLEAAILAGIPKAPARYNPLAHPGKAWMRAKHVLARMEAEGFITEEEKIQSLKEKPDIRKIAKKSDPQSYFVDSVVEEMGLAFGSGILHLGSLRIFTTFQSRMQSLAQDAVERHFRFLEKKIVRTDPESSLEAALVCIENSTGAVRAMIGGRDYSKSQFNRAVSNQRMPGSSFKPFVYMSAFQNLGYHPGTVLVDEPVVFEIPGTTPWEPDNFTGEFQGPIVLKTAFAYSINVISAKLVYRLGPKKVIRTAKQFGIRSPLSETYSLALGTSGVSPFELASAYSIIANQGIYREPFLISKIEDRAGNVLFEHFIENERRFAPEEIYPLHDMMRAVIDNGSGRVLRRMGFKHPAGGKTGTTNGFRDAWFTGYTKEYTTSVWVGIDSNDSLIGPGGKGITGSQAAAPIWGLYMKKLLKDKKTEDFERPESIRFAYVDAHSGIRSPAQAKGAVRVALRTGVGIPIPPSPQIESHRKLKIFAGIRPRIPDPLPGERVSESQSPVFEQRAAALKSSSKKKNLSGIVWFMLNVEKASLGQVARIPTRRLIRMLEATLTLGEDPKVERARSKIIGIVVQRKGRLDEAMKKVMKPEEIENIENH